MSNIDLARRRFLRQSAAAVAGSGFLMARADRLAQAAEQTAAQLVAGKDPRLIVQGAQPLELETPLALLAENRITPKSLLFVRNNQSLPGNDTTQPASDDNWRVEIAGLTDRPTTISVRDLAALDQVEHELVLQCSGNGRAAFSRLAPAKGAQWQCGAMGNVRFRGIPLAKVLERLELKPDPRARFLTAEGRDVPSKQGEADFEHSIPLDDALARSIIALSMNGEPMPAVHGGPVRLVTPGYYATMNVKWLGRLRFEERETTNYHQAQRYRTPKEPVAPGREFKYDLTNSDPNWRMRIKSVIFAPLEGAHVSAGNVEVRGVAWNDGTAPIETVMATAGANGPWLPATLEQASGPYAWLPWTIRLNLPAGEHTIAARAIDAQGRSQPATVAGQWNPAGYACSAMHVVSIVVT